MKCRRMMFPPNIWIRKGESHVALSPTKQKQLDARGSVVGNLPIEFLPEAC